MKEQLDLFEDITNIQGKPFLKWAGGKGQLIDVIYRNLPQDIDTIDTYVEPFVGSGAVMFWMLTHYRNIKHVVINDVNNDLINVYRVIQEYVNELIFELLLLEDAHKKYLYEEEKKKFFYQIRDEYNLRNQNDTQTSIRMAALFLFLNRTCFNGLYRVNSKNFFNVPFGKYSNPKICNKDLLLADSILLQNVEILNGDYYNSKEYAHKNSFFYFDPPYKPISKTSNFNSYCNEVFDDEQQKRLKMFCDELQKIGAKFMLSNSDPKSIDDDNIFFDTLYEKYVIRRVNARRNINSKGSSRGEIKELLITNY